MRRCLLVSPRFAEPNYWGYRDACELLGARYPAAPLGLVTVAALLPQTWDIRLLDLNVGEMDPALVDWADLVMASAMITQQQSVLSLIELCHARGRPVVVGGPDPSSQPEAYATADFLVLDEGELTIPRFLADLEAGATSGTYRSPEKPDVATTPIPRFDLLDFSKYLHVGVQFSRGCPFNCEFCDIIELYGRKPRTKAAPQILNELEVLYRLGYRGHVDFVDDNFIGNKKDVAALLPELLAWSRARGFPFYFSTEATINLADDPRLLELMAAVDFRYVFVGIETPDKDLLVLTQKKQNTRHPIVERVHRIYAHGIVVVAGFIVGFDGETRSAARSIVTCAEAAGIPMAIVSLMTALPTTQLTRRLAREGRLPEGFGAQRPADIDQSTSGLNFVPTRPAVEILEDYAAIVGHLYSPRSYFDRVLRVATLLRRRPKKIRGAPLSAKELVALVKVIRRLGFARATAWYFWRTLLRILATRPLNVEQAVRLMALYVHFGRQAPAVIAGVERRIARVRAAPETTRSPRPVAAPLVT
jgi:radical SAM superfamily enzyme YgiQ (UPF0313 family)